MITVHQFLDRVAHDLQEDSYLFESGAWTKEEMLGYLNTAEKLFLQKTGILQTDTSVVVAAGSTILFDRPANIIDITRISVNGKPLRRQTSWDLEREDRRWRSSPNGSPAYWHEDNISNAQYELNKIPALGGTIRIFADTMYTGYTTYLEDIHLKRTWEPYLRWKVLSFALLKDSDNQDLSRAKYADQRFMFGVYLARRLMKGISELPNR